MYPLITPGETYTFVVAAGNGVPALTRSIDFPESTPYITYPTSMHQPGREGFNVTWSESGPGMVELTMMSESGTLIFYEETDNDGSYSVSSDQLSGLASGTYMILLNLYNRELINAAGYDSRSFIAARVMSQSMFFLQ
jgi:hypothetical protein